MPKIELRLSEGKVHIEHQGELHFEDAINTLTTAMLFYMNQFTKNVKEEHQEHVRQTVYDFANDRFTQVLEMYAPEFELRPHLTTEAIMKAENEILLSQMPQSADEE
jgi:hypothetical protein